MSKSLKLNIFLALLILLLVHGLNGCGQSGPLYIPGTPPPIKVPKEEPQSIGPIASLAFHS